MFEAITTHVAGQLRMLQVATMTSLPAEDATSESGVHAAENGVIPALLFRGTRRLIAATTAGKGISCGSGSVMVRDLNLGMLLLMSRQEGHLVLLPMPTPEVASLWHAAQMRGTLHAIAVSPGRPAKLIVVDAGALHRLREVSVPQDGREPHEVLSALALAVGFFMTAPAAESLPVQFVRLRRVVIHALLPDSLTGRVCGAALEEKVVLH